MITTRKASDGLTSLRVGWHDTGLSLRLGVTLRRDADGRRMFVRGAGTTWTWNVFGTGSEEIARGRARSADAGMRRAETTAARV